MLELVKPVARTLFDYNDCASYINAKYGITIQDYAGKMTTWTPRYLEIMARVYAEVGEELGLGAEIIATVVTHGAFSARVDSSYDLKRSLVRLAVPRIRQAVYAELPPEPPYQDFWHWITETRDISDDGRFTFFRKDFADAEDWVKAIGTLFFDEFAPNADQIGFLSAF